MCSEVSEGNPRRGQPKQVRGMGGRVNGQPTPACDAWAGLPEHAPVLDVVLVSDRPPDAACPWRVRSRLGVGRDHPRSASCRSPGRGSPPTQLGSDGGQPRRPALRRRGRSEPSVTAPTTVSCLWALRWGRLGTMTWARRAASVSVTSKLLGRGNYGLRATVTGPADVRTSCLPNDAGGGVQLRPNGLPRPRRLPPRAYFSGVGERPEAFICTGPDGPLGTEPSKWSSPVVPRGAHTERPTASSGAMRGSKSCVIPVPGRGHPTG